MAIVKACSHCEEHKALDEFPKNKNGKFGVHSFCKTCKNDRSKLRYTSGDTYAARLKKLYGLSVKDYEELYAASEGCCYSCGVPEEQLTRRLAVDHCHTTGKVRGLLCGKCNTALGQLDDNEDKIANLLSYLREFK